MDPVNVLPSTLPLIMCAVDAQWAASARTFTAIIETPAPLFGAFMKVKMTVPLAFHQNRNMLLSSLRF